MPIFEIQTQDGILFQVDAPDERTAMEALNDPRNNAMGKADSAVRGVAETLSSGLSDEFSAGMDALTHPLLGRGCQAGTLSERYDQNLAQQRGIDESDRNNRFGYRLGGQLA